MKTSSVPIPVVTSDGSHTLYVPEMNEHYHSVHGAVQESEHIFIRNGFMFCKADPLPILEIGLGTGLNALLTAKESCKATRKVLYTAVEKYPLDPEITNNLNHHEFAGAAGKALFRSVHSSPWGVFNPVCSNFHLLKIKADFTASEISGKYNLFYFDAFGPDKQPEMWTPDVFEKISALSEKGAVLVTYSAKGEVKRNLRKCGFEVTLLPGPPGKRQMIRAVKI